MGKMSTIAQLQKEARNAPKYILASNIFALYIADKALTGESEDTTTNKDHALKFSVGYDDEKMKSKAWSISTGIVFTVEYL